MYRQITMVGQSFNDTFYQFYWSRRSIFILVVASRQRNSSAHGMGPLFTRKDEKITAGELPLHGDEQRNVRKC